MPSKSPIKKKGAEASWMQQDGDRYEVTGLDTRGRRFVLFCQQWRQAQAVNLYRGTKWLVRNGRRYAIVRVYN